MSPATRRREVTIDALGKAEPSFGLTKLRRQRFQRRTPLSRARRRAERRGVYSSSGDRRPVALVGFSSKCSGWWFLSPEFPGGQSGRQLFDDLQCTGASCLS